MRLSIPLVSLLALAGCPDRPVSEVPVTVGNVESIDVPAVPRRNLDLLFVIDNSGSMREEQDSLKANFRRFIEVLESIDGGLPNVHIGVVTTDLGTQTTSGGNSGLKFGCTATGENGVLRALPGGQRFLVDEADGAGGRRTNYAGALEDAFAQIAEVGNIGCGIEQHLGAMQRALEPTNLANQGFVREDAILAVVFIADEDDCSQANTGLFDGSTNGDEVNFRCTYDGVECALPSTDFLQAEGPRMECKPKGTRRWVESVDRYVDFLKTVKRDPADVVVAGILGERDKFEITKKTSSAGTATVLKESCEYRGPSEKQLAFPAIRIGAFLDQFPQQSANETICTEDLSGPVQRVAQLIAKGISKRCFLGELLDVDPVTDGPQYFCSVTQLRRLPDGTKEEVAILPDCATDDSSSCWTIAPDPERCGFTDHEPHLAIDMTWATPPTSDMLVKVECITADDDGDLQ